MWNWVTMLYSRKKLYWGTNNKKIKKKFAAVEIEIEKLKIFIHLKSTKSITYNHK